MYVLNILEFNIKLLPFEYSITFNNRKQDGAEEVTEYTATNYPVLYKYQNKRVLKVVNTDHCLNDIAKAF